MKFTDLKDRIAGNKVYKEIPIEITCQESDLQKPSNGISESYSPDGNILTVHIPTSEKHPGLISYGNTFLGSDYDAYYPEITISDEFGNLTVFVILLRNYEIYACDSAKEGIFLCLVKIEE